MSTVETIIFSISVIAALTLWIPLFIFGIYKVMRKEKKKGVYLIIASAIWFLVVFGGAGFAGVYLVYNAFTSISTPYKTVDFKPEQYQGEIGEIILTYGKNATITALDSKNHTVTNSSGTDGVIKFPSGKHFLSRVNITEKDTDGKDWRLSVPLYKKFSDITISKDKPVEIKIAPPFIATVLSSKKKGEDVFDFELKDCIGNSVSIFGSSSSKPRDQLVPRFQLVDSGGNVVFEKDFEYG